MVPLVLFIQHFRAECYGNCRVIGRAGGATLRVSGES